MSKLLAGLLYVTLLALWVLVAGYGALSGWWMRSIVESKDHDKFSEWAIAQIRSKNKGNSAFVLLEDGAIASEHIVSTHDQIDRNTLFPTASFSKWITAMVIMSLVERGDIELDTAVTEYLSRWHLPERSYENQKVTIRRLLSHTAGLTDQLGFGDYLAEDTLPSLENELTIPKASSGEGVEIRVGIEPGSEFLYSGGGYLILQLVIEEVTGTPFTDYARKVILEPLAMSRSSWAYAGDLENVTPAYNQDGTLAPHYKYASAAATAFLSTPADLTHLVKAFIAQNASVLDPGLQVSMRQPQANMFGIAIWGIGTILYAQTDAGDFVYGHDGVNSPAINATVRINPATADAIIVLVNGHPTLASNIGSEWVLWQTGNPDFLSIERALGSAIYPAIIGIVIITLFCFFAYRIKRSHTA